MCTAPWVGPSAVPIKCGQCVECRLAYSREWAIRITHEQMMSKSSCMVTLTYDDQHLPFYGQLVKSDLQKFFKRLRKAGYRFRYVACGEYGDQSRRPHFHVALFGEDFHQDRIRYSQAVNGDPTFRSKLLNEIWGQGQCDIGSLNFESAAYIARYIMKKIKGPGASPMPLYSDSETGELVMPNPEFLVASKGIGKSWFRDFFMSDVFPHAGVITQQGTRAPVPRYYKNLLKEVGQDLALDMQFRSSVRADLELERTAFENMPHRKSARAIVSNARTRLSKRTI